MDDIHGKGVFYHQDPPLVSFELDFPIQKQGIFLSLSLAFDSQEETMRPSVSLPANSGLMWHVFPICNTHFKCLRLAARLIGLYKVTYRSYMNRTYPKVWPLTPDTCMWLSGTLESLYWEVDICFYSSVFTWDGQLTRVRRHFWGPLSCCTVPLANALHCSFGLIKLHLSVTPYIIMEFSGSGHSNIVSAKNLVVLSEMDVHTNSHLKKSHPEARYFFVDRCDFVSITRIM